MGFLPSLLAVFIGQQCLLISFTYQSMSIAVSAIIRPSRILSGFILGMAGLFILISVAVFTGQLGEFAGYGTEIVGITNLCMALFLLFIYFREQKTFQIDISGIGKIRIREIKEARKVYLSEADDINQSREEFHIIKGSTVWPSVLFLWLESNSGSKIMIRVFSDSVKKDEFRALYVACRWIATHGKENI